MRDAVVNCYAVLQSEIYRSHIYLSNDDKKIMTKINGLRFIEM